MSDDIKILFALACALLACIVILVVFGLAFQRF